METCNSEYDPSVSFDSVVLRHLAVALLCGLAVGTERQWSGHASGRHAHLGGLRTFTMLGLVSGLSGWLWTAGLEGPALILLAGVAALVVVAYLAASRHDIDGTTDVAAFVVMASGLLAGLGEEAVASGITAVTLLLLVEKKQLHGIVSKIDRGEMRAGARFAVMAAVILPLLPVGPYGPLGGIRPRQLWLFVLFFSGLSFLGYFARRAFGRNRGYAVAGTLGGLLSSTSVTLTFSRLSQSASSAGRALAAGTLGANVVMFPRVLLASAALAPALALALWPSCVAPVAIGAILFFRGLHDTGRTDRLQDDSNPLQFKNALQMAVAFQLVLLGVTYARTHFGQQGVLGSAAVMGAFDVDAVTISMAQMTKSGAPAALTARAVTIGVLSNTIVKLGIAVVIGRGRFRPLAAAGLVLMALALVAAVWWR
jgi:uncharacterized membrane protein (DUF4010 family)